MLTKPTIASLADRFSPRSRWGAVVLGPRRQGHGGLGWTAEEDLKQPQDGALQAESMVQTHSLRFRGVLSRLNEPEDAKLTGAKRSLGRRLLGLNVAARPKPVMSDTPSVLRLTSGKGQPQVA